MSKHDDTQPEMLFDDDPDQFRHPMWTHPEGDPREPQVPRWRLRYEIATALTAYEDRAAIKYRLDRLDLVLAYLEEVYQATTRESAGNYLILLGQIHWQMQKAVSSIQARLEGLGPGSDKDLHRYLRNNRDIIIALADRLAWATTKEMR